MVWSDNAFISKPNVCFSYSVCLVVIGCMVTSRNRKDKYSLSIFLFCGEENRGVGEILSLISLLMSSASFCGSASPTTLWELSTPKKRVPPAVFAKALTLLSQLLGFFTSRASLKSQTVASAINVLIIWLSFGFLNYRKENFMYRALILDPIRIPSDYFFLINNILI